MIDLINPRFSNLKKIQNIFLHCFYQSEETELLFKNLVSIKEIDFSRYNYFYAIYLVDSNRVEQAKRLINTSLKSYPRNLLLNQYKRNLKQQFFWK